MTIFLQTGKQIEPGHEKKCEVSMLEGCNKVQVHSFTLHGMMQVPYNTKVQAVEVKPASALYSTYRSRLLRGRGNASSDAVPTLLQEGRDRLVPVVLVSDPTVR